MFACSIFVWNQVKNGSSAKPIGYVKFRIYLKILLSGKHFEKEKKWAGFRKRNPAFLVYICFDEKK